MQTITSKNTSVNTIKLPSIYNKIYWEGLKKLYGDLVVFDFGCGRKTDHIQDFLKKKDIRYIEYDPYWKPFKLETFTNLIKHSREIYECVPIIICSNVLNVIPEWKQVLETKEYIFNLCEPYFIKVYEGDKSRVGKQTKKDCWQWNMPIRSYQTSEFEIIRNGILTHQLYERFL